jgi:hypothetical protein
LHVVSISRSIHEDIIGSARICQNDANFHKTIFIQAGRSLKGILWLASLGTLEADARKINIQLRAYTEVEVTLI